MTPWLIACAMALAALVFVLPPWLRSPSSEAGPREDARLKTLRALHRSRREEIEADARAGLLAAEDREAALAELDAALLRDLEAAVETAEGSEVGAAATSGSARGRAPLIALALALTLAGGTLWLYGRLGEPDAPALVGAAELLKLEESDVAALRRWQTLLTERIARRPEDAKSRYLLGHVALKQRRYDAAADAFASAAKAHGQPDPNIELYLLQARFLAAEGQLDAESRALAERLLQQRPTLAPLYEVLAIDAFNRRDFAAAVGILNRALAQPLGPGQRASFQTGLKQARAQLGSPADAGAVAAADDSPAATERGSAAAVGPAIDVTIKGLAQVPRERTLFVIARPPGGGMPYAVVRRPGPDFPETVRLDDLVSMNPAAPLSTAAEVEVIVRASVTGTAQRSAQDWQWASPTLSLRDGQQHALTAELQPPG